MKYFAFFLLMLAFVVFGAGLIEPQAAPVNYNESTEGDLPSLSPQFFRLDAGLNQWTGAIERSPNSDSWAASLPVNHAITNIHFKGPAGGQSSTFAGFFEYTCGSMNQEVRTGSLHETFSPALTSSCIMLRVVADFNTAPKNWSVTINVMAINDDDGDGITNDADICPGGDDAVDTDGDLIPDACDVTP